MEEAAALPEVDLQFMEGGDAGARRQALRAMERACREIGCFSVVRAPVTSPVIEDAYAQARRFFGYPDGPEKRRIWEKRVPFGRGWSAMGEGTSYEAGTVALCESFNIALETDPEPGRREFADVGPNAWPDFLPGFRDDVYGCYLALWSFAHRLFELFEEMLALPDGFLRSKHTERARCLMRLLRYPAVAAALAEHERGIGVHTDFECFTLINQDAPGLEVRSLDGRWIRPAMREDRFVVLIGDILERYTNGSLRATPHRVLNGREERCSIVYFAAVENDTVVEPLPGCVTTGTSPRYPPITQRDHLIGAVHKAVAEHQAATAAE